MCAVACGSLAHSSKTLDACESGASSFDQHCIEACSHGGAECRAMSTHAGAGSKLARTKRKLCDKFDRRDHVLGKACITGFDAAARDGCNVGDVVSTAPR